MAHRKVNNKSGLFLAGPLFYSVQLRRLRMAHKLFPGIVAHELTTRGLTVPSRLVPSRPHLRCPPTPTHRT